MWREAAGETNAAGDAGSASDAGCRPDDRVIDEVCVKRRIIDIQHIQIGSSAAAADDVADHRGIVAGIEQHTAGVEVVVQGTGAAIHGDYDSLRAIAIAGRIGIAGDDQVREVGFEAVAAEIGGIRHQRGARTADGDLGHAAAAEPALEGAVAADLGHHQHAGGGRAVTTAVAGVDVVGAFGKNHAIHTGARVGHRAMIELHLVVARGRAADSEHARRASCRVEAGIEAGRSGAAGRRQQAFDKALASASNGEARPHHDDISSPGINAQLAH